MRLDLEDGETRWYGGILSEMDAAIAGNWTALRG